MLKRELTEILHPVQEDLARVSSLLQGAALADGVADTRSIAKELCDRIEGLAATVEASVNESGALREESSRLVEGGTDQMAVASSNLEGLAKDLAERLSELGSAIETQALVVAPRIVEEVAASFQLPVDEPRRLRRRADVGTGLAVAALRQDLEAIRKDLASVGPDLGHITPTIDSLAQRQTELEQKIDSLAGAVSKLAAKREKTAATAVSLTAKDRSALASAIADAIASRQVSGRGKAAAGPRAADEGRRAADEGTPEEQSDKRGDEQDSETPKLGSVTKAAPRRRKPRVSATAEVTTSEPAVLWPPQRAVATRERSG
jgi:predicted  nucleic acid-binding Zn-ribbon protein